MYHLFGSKFVREIVFLRQAMNVSLDISLLHLIRD
jgi:hypothetical protein